MTTPSTLKLLAPVDFLIKNSEKILGACQIVRTLV